MYDNRWDDADAAAWVQAAGPDAADQALALRVYSSRLIGSDPDLVMHGGGNTSLKTTRRDVFGQTVGVLHIKGSGWDLGDIQAQGMPGVRMDVLHRLRALDALSDEDMVNVQRSALLDSAAPNPSVETLLHAWLPAPVVDHTHATAFLALANLPDVAAATAEIFGDRLALVPYLMPGFALAKAACAIRDAHPRAEGLVLINHGHFTWGDDAKSSYLRLLDHTRAVDDWLARHRSGTVHAVPAMPQTELDTLLPTLLPTLRGAIGAHLPPGAALPLFDLRATAAARAFLARDDIALLAERGVATPDHVIRTKAHPLILSLDAATPGVGGAAPAVAGFVARYTDYFARQNARVGGIKTALAPAPGLVWVPGLGLIGLGTDAAAARIAADIGEQTIRVMADGQAAGGFHPIAEDDTFDCEYWSLEQAKLGKGTPPPLRGRIVLITGGAGAIGLATARAFRAAGAALFLVDLDPAALDAALAALGRDHGGIACDITRPGAPDAAVAACVARFGGLDILISNAGAALQGEVATLPDATLQAGFALNFFAPHAMAQAAVAVFRTQNAARNGAETTARTTARTTAQSTARNTAETTARNTAQTAAQTAAQTTAQTTARGGAGAANGGQILFNVSKQAVNPGRGMAAYGLPKAATMFLLRQLALELGAEGIRVNGINADRIRSGLLTGPMIAARAAARAVDAATYMAGNLLQAEVEARHVADAFVMLARSERTTAHVMTVDGGNIEAALR